MTIYILAWALLNSIFYSTGMFRPLEGDFMHKVYLMLFQLLFLFGFLLLVFLGPHIQWLNETEEKSKKQFEKLNDEMFKQPWKDAINDKNRYYIIAFTLFAFVPFFYMSWFFYSSPSLLVTNQITLFDIFLLQFVAGFSGFVVYLYTLFAKRRWYFYVVPLVYALAFFKADNTNAAARLRNYVASLLLLIWPFFYLSKTSILWSIPFLILIPPLFYN